MDKLYVDPRRQLIRDIKAADCRFSIPRDEINEVLVSVCIDLRAQVEGQSYHLPQPRATEQPIAQFDQPVILHSGHEYHHVFLDEQSRSIPSSCLGSRYSYLGSISLLRICNLRPTMAAFGSVLVIPSLDILPWNIRSQQYRMIPPVAREKATNVTTVLRVALALYLVHTLERRCVQQIQSE